MACASQAPSTLTMGEAVERVCLSTFIGKWPASNIFVDGTDGKTEAMIHNISCTQWLRRRVNNGRFLGNRGKNPVVYRAVQEPAISRELVSNSIAARSAA